MGTDLHQMTIMNVRWGMNEIAGSLTRTGQPAPWQALSQTIVTGFQRSDGSRYKTLPDVFVYLRPIDRRRGSVSIAIDGPPVLIIEVLSESTYEVDLDFAHGKGFSYAHAGVREYLVLDPTGEFVPEQCRAWRLADEGYRPWLPDAPGRWQSEQIAVAVGIEDTLPAVYSRDGQRQLREGEIDAALARRDAEVAELRRLVQQLQRNQS